MGQVVCASRPVEKHHFVEKHSNGGSNRVVVQLGVGALSSLLRTSCQVLHDLKKLSWFSLAILLLWIAPPKKYQLERDDCSGFEKGSYIPQSTRLH
jgi:hypothetical protein